MKYIPQCWWNRMWWRSALQSVIRLVILIHFFTQLPEELVCVYVDKDTKLVSTYLYNRLSKDTNKVEYTELDKNPYSDHSLLRLATTIQISYKFSTKKG